MDCPAAPSARGIGPSLHLRPCKLLMDNVLREFGSASRLSPQNISLGTKMLVFLLILQLFPAGPVFPSLKAREKPEHNSLDVRFVATARLQQLRGMQDKLQGVEGRTAGTERRAGMR